MAEQIPFNRPFVSGREGEAIAAALTSGHTGGNGPFCSRCEEWLQKLTGAARVLLTPSGTAALELAALLLGVGPGDEVIMPSFTFASTANAFALRGATPVFVDIGEDDLTLDPERAAEAVTERTRAIVPVHYGGGAARMDALMRLAAERGLSVVEDAAQGVLARWAGRQLGSIGDLGAFSFHETKNLSCGEGGALVVNRAELVERAEVLQEKGTNRLRFVRGEIHAYTWVDVGSSFVLSDLSAALLWTQLERAEEITRERLGVWARYFEAFEPLEAAGIVRRPQVATDVSHNAHAFYLLLEDGRARDDFIAALAADGIRAQFHYVPLHSSPAGRRLGRAHGALTTTDDVAARLVRLPLWPGMSEAQVERVIRAARGALSRARPALTQPAS